MRLTREQQSDASETDESHKCVFVYVHYIYLNVSDVNDSVSQRAPPNFHSPSHSSILKENKNTFPLTGNKKRKKGNPAFKSRFFNF